MTKVLVISIDAADSLTFVSAGKGYIDILKAGKELRHINRISTSSGARTSLLLISEKYYCLQFLHAMEMLLLCGFIL